MNKSLEEVKANDDTTPASPSLNLNEINSYSLQCFVDWINGIESDNKIIELDFDKIEADLKQQLEKDKTKCKDLFYPNIQSFHQKDENKIENWYKKLFGGEPSIIHYILYNKSFLYALPNPDVYKRQSKLDNIKKKSAELFHLNMQQSIYILRLLLFKYQIINPNTVLEDNCTIMISIEEELRDILMTNTFDYDDIKEEYLKLVIDVASISEEIRQTAIFNILYIEDREHFSLVNFFDNVDIRSSKMKQDMIQELLFRGIQPLSIRIFEKYTAEKFNVKKNEIDIKRTLHGFIDEVMRLDWKQTAPRDESTYPEPNVYDHYWSYFIVKLNAVTAPLIIRDLAKLAKQKMYNLLNKWMVQFVNRDCIYCILDFIYVDLDTLYPEGIEDNITIQMGKYFNYLFEIDLDESLMNNVLKRKYLTKSMAQYLFSEIGEDILDQILTDVFKRKVVALQTLYELCMLQTFSNRSFEKFMFTLIYGWSEIPQDVKELFVKIVSVNIFDSDKLNDEALVTNRDELSDRVDELFNTNYTDHDTRIQAEREFIDELLQLKR